MIEALFSGLGPHAAYIVASYAVAGLVCGWMIASSVAANRAALRKLDAIEAHNDNQPGAPHAGISHAGIPR